LQLTAPTHQGVAVQLHSKLYALKLKTPLRYGCCFSSIMPVPICVRPLFCETESDHFNQHRFSKLTLLLRQPIFSNFVAQCGFIGK